MLHEPEPGSKLVTNAVRGNTDGENLWITGGLSARTICHGRLDDLKCVAGSNHAEISHQFKNTKLALMFHTTVAIQQRDGSRFLTIFDKRTHPSN